MFSLESSLRRRELVSGVRFSGPGEGWGTSEIIPEVILLRKIASTRVHDTEQSL